MKNTLFLTALFMLNAVCCFAKDQPVAVFSAQFVYKPGGGEYRGSCFVVEDKNKTFYLLTSAHNASVSENKKLVKVAAKTAFGKKTIVQSDKFLSTSGKAYNAQGGAFVTDFLILPIEAPSNAAVIFSIDERELPERNEQIYIVAQDKNKNEFQNIDGELQIATKEYLGVRVLKTGLDLTTFDGCPVISKKNGKLIGIVVKAKESPRQTTEIFATPVNSIRQAIERKDAKNLALTEYIR